MWMRLWFNAVRCVCRRTRTLNMHTLQPAAVTHNKNVLHTLRGKHTHARVGGATETYREWIRHITENELELICCEYLRLVSIMLFLREQNAYGNRVVHRNTSERQHVQLTYIIHRNAVQQAFRDGRIGAKPSILTTHTTCGHTVTGFRNTHGPYAWCIHNHPHSFRANFVGVCFERRSVVVAFPLCMRQWASVFHHLSNSDRLRCLFRDLINWMCRAQFVIRFTKGEEKA